ncbi:MAG: HD domain-containing protein [Acidobacteria bacterium]|nr:HD domain-containing protein [Acidobacteriota bacterium]
MEWQAVQAPTEAGEWDRQTRLKSALIENSVASTSALVSFLAALYRYSPDTLAHVQRVAAASISIGGGMALSREELRHVERAALAHDLGRLLTKDDAKATRSSGATSPDPSLRREGEQRGRQAELARDVLTAAPALRRAADIVGAQFERIDGSGWPRGLQGDQIPVGARIVGVADAYDALTSLCLELGLSADVIAVELVRHAGTRFDARVVAACLRWMDGSFDDAPHTGHTERLM